MISLEMSAQQEFFFSQVFYVNMFAGDKILLSHWFQLLCFFCLISFYQACQTFQDVVMPFQYLWAAGWLTVPIRIEAGFEMLTFPSNQQ